MPATVMRSEASSLTCNLTPLAKISCGGHRSVASFSCGTKQQPPPYIRASSDHSRPHTRALVCPQPPWLVLPPSPPENPFSGQAWPSDLHMKAVGGTEVPLSLRMVQRKKRLAVAVPLWTDAPAQAVEVGAVAGDVEGPLQRAVSALVFMIGELQRSAMAGGDGCAVDEAVLDKVSRERRDSIVWLLRRVFFSSPDLVASLLLLLADYVAASAEMIGSAALALAASADEVSGLEGRSVELAPENSRIGNYLNWFDVGIQEGSLERRQRESEETCIDRRRRAYERTIAEGSANSLILCNYAQFLYRVAHDYDRAEQYFQWAVMAEPRDAEAMSRYAFFLWEERGDITGAEERFLEAIEVEPGSHHHTSNYAWFLWKTGAVDTCYPLNPPTSLVEDVD